MFNIQEAFEIVYDDFTVIRGTTREEFEAASSTGIQIVVIRYRDGIITHRAQDFYHFKGIIKPGSWTDRENYEAIKKGLKGLSRILSGDL